MHQPDFSSVAAKRYRKYRLKQSRDSFKKKVISFLFRLFQAIARALQKAGLLRRKVETVTVE
jgi:hypothetical protein